MDVSIIFGSLHVAILGKIRNHALVFLSSSVSNEEIERNFICLNLLDDEQFP